MVKKYILLSFSIILFVYLQVLFLIGLSFIELLTLPYIFLSSLITIFLTTIMLKLYFSRNSKVYNTGVMFTILLNFISFYNVYNLNREYKYLQNFINNDYKYVTYNVYVQKKNTYYNEIEKLSGKKIGVLANKNNINSHFEQRVDIEFIRYRTIEELEYAIQNGEIQSFILNENEYQLLVKYTELDGKIRVIYTNKIIDTI